MRHASLLFAALPLVLLAHAALGWLILAGPAPGSAAPAQRKPVSMQVLSVAAPAAAAADSTRDRGDEAVHAARRDTRPAQTPPASALAVPRPSPFDGFKSPRELDRAAVPRSAPDVSMLDGLPFSGLPIRLRLFVDRTGLVVEVVALQADEDDEVVERVRRMFLSTAFIAGRLRGEDVASYKDVELALGLP